MSTDEKVAAASVVLYVALVLTLLPPGEYPRAVGGGLIVFGAVAAAAHHMGRGAFSGHTVLAVAFASGAVLAVPTFPAMGGRSREAVPIAFFGMQVAVLIWAALRWKAQPAAEQRTSIFEAWVAGFFCAVGLSAIATIPVLIVLASGEASARVILWVYPAYLVGLLAAATFYWLLQPIAHLATGRYLIGFLGGSCVYGAVAPIVQVIADEPMSTGAMLVIALIAGGLVGPALALDTTNNDQNETAAPAR